MDEEKDNLKIKKEELISFHPEEKARKAAACTELSDRAREAVKSFRVTAQKQRGLYVVESSPHWGNTGTFCIQKALRDCEGYGGGGDARGA